MPKAYERGNAYKVLVSTGYVLYHTELFYRQSRISNLDRIIKKVPIVKSAYKIFTILNITRTNAIKRIGGEKRSSDQSSSTPNELKEKPPSE